MSAAPSLPDSTDGDARVAERLPWHITGSIITWLIAWVLLFSMPAPPASGQSPGLTILDAAVWAVSIFWPLLPLAIAMALGQIDRRSDPAEPRVSRRYRRASIGAWISAIGMSVWASGMMFIRVRELEGASVTASLGGGPSDALPLVQQSAGVLIVGAGLIFAVHHLRRT